MLRFPISAVICIAAGVVMLGCHTAERKRAVAIEQVKNLPYLINSGDCAPIVPYIDPRQTKEMWIGGRPEATRRACSSSISLAMTAIGFRFRR